VRGVGERGGRREGKGREAGEEREEAGVSRRWESFIKR